MTALPFSGLRCPWTTPTFPRCQQVVSVRTSSLNGPFGDAAPAVVADSLESHGQSVTFLPSTTSVGP